MDCCSSCRSAGRGTNPNDRPTERPASQRHRGNINPLKNATAALNGRRRRRNQRRTDRSAWKPVIKCELSSLIRRPCTKVVVTCRRRLPLSVQNSTSCSPSAVGRSVGRSVLASETPSPSSPHGRVSLITVNELLPSAAVIQLANCLLKSAQTCRNKYLAVLYGQSGSSSYSRFSSDSSCCAF